MAFTEYHGSNLTVSLECFILIDFLWKIIQGFLSLQFLKAITRLCWETLKNNEAKNVKKSNSLSYTFSVGIKPQV